MNGITKKYLFGFIVIAGIFGLTNIVQASIISINPQIKEFSTGETFLVEVHLNSEKEVINTVAATINYSNDLLEVEKISKGGSFLTLWAQEPAVEKSAGVIDLAGGIPGGSLVLDGKILTITFRSKMAGVGEVNFGEKTKVLLNDGLGTETSLTTVSGIFTINQNTFIDIESPTHPDENSWYANNNFTVKWQMKKNAIYSYILSRQSDEEPDNNRESTTGQVNFSELNDGVYYFILKEKIDGGEWKIIGKRRGMIDTESQLPIETEISNDEYLYGGQNFLIFSATDKGSGVDYYKVQEGTYITDNAKSPYILQDQTRKDVIIITAYDKAGNFISYNLNENTYSNISDKSNEDNIFVSIIIIILVGLVAFLLLQVFFKFYSNKGEKNQES